MEGEGELGKKLILCRQLSTEPIFRGRKLVMNYTDGSPCEDVDRRRSLDGDEDEDDRWGDDEGGKEKEDKPRKSTVRRKSTLISFLCDQESYDSSRPKVAVSFVGWSPDECAYTFEARSHLSCGGLAKQPESTGPGAVFGLM